MALQYSIPAPGVRSLRTRAASLIARVGGTVSDWNNRRDVRARLSRLSAHELADIGLDRGDLDQLLRG